ncbi:hypothetical protein SUDANB145_07324 (plasmid) [Streptomyces sp. enrichment culture]|uniref:hypothetical protein n=1 Tax=Streptomyces sp. enrichment culture TaxID=1795815 RepID=UPI003F54FC00
MTDDLTRRVVANQIRDEVAAVVRDAERLAQAYTQLAHDVAAGRAMNGEAYRLTQSANEVLRRSARLDGLREIAEVAGLAEPRSISVVAPAAE